MKNLLVFAALFAALAVFAAPAAAQIALNEIRLDQTSTDNDEFIELKSATPGFSVAGYVVCVVEGDGASAGTLDRVYDLSTAAVTTTDANGFYLLGSSMSTMFGGSVDFDFPFSSNNLENGTETFYLIQVQDLAGLTAAIGTSVATGPATTSLSSFGTIVDLVAVADSGITGGDVAFDGAPVLGPNGTFVPSGIFCDGDVQGAWCSTLFLDFSDFSNDTPKAPNVACPMPMSAAFPGNGGDVVIDTFINGLLQTPTNGVHALDTTNPGENFSLQMSSPGGTLDNNGFALITTITPQGMGPAGLPLLPGDPANVWIDPSSAVILLDGLSAPTSAFVPTLSPFGFEYGPFPAAPLFAGLAARVQAFAAAPGFNAVNLALSDAVELNFN